MKNFTLFLLGFFLLFSVVASAQLCGFDQGYNEMLKNEAIAKQMLQNEEQIQRIIKSGIPRLHSDPPYTIPVVFHVIHTGGAIGSSYNPSDADLLNMLDYTNKVYAGTAAGMSGGIGNMQVQFVLAKRDPNCNPTTGIVRVNASGVAGYTQYGVRKNGANGAPELTVKNLSRWNTSLYYNIWIVNKLDGADGLDGQPVVAGFAYYPGGAANLDGAMMLSAFSKDGNKVLPHELGHAFNLFHTFQGSTSAAQCPANANCSVDGDRVCDTDPVSQNVTGGVSDFTCRTGTNPCTATPYSPNTENNIMGYTNCFTLFTTGQRDRVWAAMSLADRVSLTTSLGGTAPNTGSICAPKINFATGAGDAAEAPGATIDCRKYTDYTFQMAIGSNPSLAATATISTGGTATNAYDFILTTNDNFASPSTTLNFPAGSSASQPFKIRVFDDGYIEGNETIVLGFTVNANGGTAIKGDGIAEMTVTIRDNDTEPVSIVEKTDVVGTLSFQLGSPAGGSNPLNAQLAQNKSIWLIKASELTARGFKAGTIKQVAIYLLKNSTRPFLNFQVKMGATALNYLVDGSLNIVATSTVKTIASFSTVNQWNVIPLDVPFVWNGTSSICIEMCYQNDAADALQSSDVSVGYTDGGSGTQSAFYWQNDKNCTTPFGGSFGLFYNGYKPTTGIVMDIAPNPTEVLVNVTTTGYLGPFGEMYFYSASGSILAKVKNLTNWDYGCTSVTIDRAGTGTKAFINNNAANAISDKTISVIPANNNPAGQYEITLFYRPDEVAGYKTGTGTLWKDAGIAKATNAISSYPPGSVPVEATVMGTSIVKGVYGLDSTIKATFSGSFSGFGVVPESTVLPVNWLSFDGKIVRGNAELAWSTASEQNNSHFDVEISRDANSFAGIGTVKGAGTSTRVNKYAFTHVKPLAGINYYRIRQVDKDGKSSLSQVIGLRSEAIGGDPTLYPNPATSRVMLDWGGMAGQAGRWELLTTDMKALKAGQSAFTSSVQGIDIGQLPSGVYYLRLVSGKEVKVLRFVKQ